jgi:hypothetical protein
MPVIPGPGRLRQEDQEFETSLGYIAGLCLKKTKQKDGALLTFLDIFPKLLICLMFLGESRYNKV